MKKPRLAKRSSDEAVKAKTGKVWAEWFKLLDRAGARKLPHKEIAAHLHDEHKVTPWWSQMVAVAYEHERGLRQEFQNCAGEFSANASRTLPIPVARVFRAWADDKLRERWLSGGKMEITTATPGKSLRAKWDSSTRLSVYFYVSGTQKTRVAVDHMKLANSQESLKMKSFWSSALDRLEKMLSP